MSAGERKVVWVLGSGFSKPLGGPMLTDLLQPRATETIRALYPMAKHLSPSNPAIAMVPMVFAEGLPLRFWTDAEDFLDQVDAAASEGASKLAGKRFIQLARAALTERAKRTLSMQGFPDELLEPLGPAARRLIAAECCAFLDSSAPTTERWTPYHDWAGALAGDSHTIVTFNYDRVLESLGKFDILKPAGDFDGRHDDKGMPQVLKLHGSVDWMRVESKEPNGAVSYVPTETPIHALLCPESQIAILTPGPSKQLSAKELPLLWSTARERLQSADAIVFVGYRFPPSDAEARKILLRAIENNHAGPDAAGSSAHHLALHIVLGPRTAHEDVIRLEQLLHAVMARAGRYRGSPRAHERTYAAAVHAMFAEDFFTVFSPDGLFR